MVEITPDLNRLGRNRPMKTGIAAREALSRTA